MYVYQQGEAKMKITNIFTNKKTNTRYGITGSKGAYHVRVERSNYVSGRQAITWRVVNSTLGGVDAATAIKILSKKTGVALEAA